LIDYSILRSTDKKKDLFWLANFQKSTIKKSVNNILLEWVGVMQQKGKLELRAN
jgi:hypothetical protein